MSNPALIFTVGPGIELADFEVELGVALPPEAAFYVPHEKRKRSILGKLEFLYKKEHLLTEGFEGDWRIAIWITCPLDWNNLKICLAFSLYSWIREGYGKIACLATYDTGEALFYAPRDGVIQIDRKFHESWQQNPYFVYPFTAHSIIDLGIKE